MSATPRDYLELHLVVLAWGFTAIFGLLISVPALEVVLYRTLVASVGLWVLLLFRKSNFAIGRREIFKIAGTGLLIGLHWIMFFGSARLSTASISLAAMATTSLWTTLLEPLMTEHKKIKWYELVLGIMAVAGMVIIFNVEFRFAWGLIVGIGAAILSAVFTILNAGLVKRHDHFTITFYEMVSAFLGLLLILSFYKGPLKIEWPGYSDWLWLLLLGGICTVYAYSISVKVMKRLRPFVVNLTINLEPIYGILLAIVVFGENEAMKPGFYWGTAIILISVLAYPMINRYQRWKSQKAVRF